MVPRHMFAYERGGHVLWAGSRVLDLGCGDDQHLPPWRLFWPIRATAFRYHDEPPAWAKSDSIDSSIWHRVTRNTHHCSPS